MEPPTKRIFWHADYCCHSSGKFDRYEYNYLVKFVYTDLTTKLCQCEELFVSIYCSRSHSDCRVCSNTSFSSNRSVPLFRQLTQQTHYSEDGSCGTEVGGRQPAYCSRSTEPSMYMYILGSSYGILCKFAQCVGYRMLPILTATALCSAILYSVKY